MKAHVMKTNKTIGNLAVARDVEDLEWVRDVLSDIKYSIKVNKSSCGSCGTCRWDDWNAYQVRQHLDGALHRVEKALAMLDK